MNILKTSPIIIRGIRSLYTQYLEESYATLLARINATPDTPTELTIETKKVS